YMPITAATFLIGTLAICGIPPLAGFWSKDEILDAAFQANPALWLVGWLTAGITAFYMFRMYFMTFEGEFRGTDHHLVEMVKRENGSSKKEGHGHHSHKPHESPWTMTLPLVTLAIPSIFIGLVGTPFGNYFEAFIHAPGEAVEAVTGFKMLPPKELQEFAVMAGSSVGIALVGITIAILTFALKKIDPDKVAKTIEPLYQLSKNKWYFDEIYDFLFVQGSRRLSRQVLEVDARIVDGVVNLTGLITLITGEGLKYFESGRAQFYALVVFIGVLGLVVFTATS
ncbi:MAG: proton-conducting transporter membrane subunit, partial [Pseudanabaenaceae cyanobacterium]